MYTYPDSAQLFKAIDVDGSGTLSRVEIQLALKRYGFSEGKINDLFNAADANHDNVLSVQEFAKGMVPILMQVEGIQAQSDIYQDMCIYVYMFVCVCVCVCVYLYIYRYVDVCTHIFI